MPPFLFQQVSLLYHSVARVEAIKYLPIGPRKGLVCFVCRIASGLWSQGFEFDVRCSCPSSCARICVCFC